MKTLSVIKKEAREELLSKVSLPGFISYIAAKTFLEETLDRLTDAVLQEVLAATDPQSAAVRAIERFRNPESV